MIYLALIAAACPIIDASDVALGSMEPRDADGVPVGYDGALSTGEPRDVMTRLECFGLCEPNMYGVTWSTSDPAVVTVTESGSEGTPDPYDRAEWKTATVLAVAPGTAEIIATSTAQRWIETRAPVTVTDDVEFAFVQLVEADRATTVGTALAIEVDLALYGSPATTETAVAWKIDDTNVAIAEATSLDAVTPHVYRSTLLLRSRQPGPTMRVWLSWLRFGCCARPTPTPPTLTPTTPTTSRPASTPSDRARPSSSPPAATGRTPARTYRWR